MLLALTLLGCDAIRETLDVVDNITDTRVVGGIVLDVVPPEDPELLPSLEDAGLEGGTVATAFLALAERADDLTDVPFPDATVTLSNTDTTGTLESQGDGSYLMEPDASALQYAAGDTWTLHIEGLDTTDSSVTLRLPEALDAGAQLPTTHEPGQPLSLTRTDPSIEQLLVVVTDSSGDITFSNEPTDIASLYRFTHGELTEELEIPGTAFPEPDLYVVGVAGLNFTEAADLEGLNTLLSSVAVGRMTLHPVSTLPELPSLP